MISKTFTFITRIEVPPELDHLLMPLDGMFARGTLHNSVASKLNIAFGGYSVKEKSLAGRVLVRAGKWVDGLTIEHKNHNPADNQLDNLDLITQTENTRRRRKQFPLTHHLMPQTGGGVRIYAFAVEVKLDDFNSDLMQQLEYKYTSGTLQYRVTHAVVSPAGNGSLAYKVLAANGIQIPKGMTVDHINGDHGLNLPDNLRVVTMSINNQNKGNNRLQLAV